MKAWTAAGGHTATRVTDGDRGGTPDIPGRLLGRLSVLPALVSMAWLLPGLPLLLAGRFTPVLMLVFSVPLAVMLIVIGLRWTPDRWDSALPVPGRGHARTPWWAVAGVLAVAAGFGADQMIHLSQEIIVTRDPAAYIQFGAWISQHGSLPIPQGRAAFGGAHDLLNFSSAAFFQVGSTIVPQFMAALPMVLAAGFWSGGVGAAVAMAPILGACAVLTFGGLAARLAGPRWAPLAALVLALSLPEQVTSRATYSEPLAQIVFLGGLCLVIDSLEGNGAGARIAAALGGLAIGFTVLARIDGVSDVLPVIPYGGILLISRRRQAIPLLGGFVLGGIYGVVDGVVLSRPYLALIKSSVVPLTLVAGIVVIATAVAVAVLWGRGLPRVGERWLPNAAAVSAVAVIIFFAVRSQIAQQATAGHQRPRHVTPALMQLYFDLSLHWVFWYIGIPAVALATFAAALLARRCLRGGVPAWTLPLMVFAWTIVTVLYRPAIEPDQPWASRRLVPAVLPGFILLAIWGTGWLIGRLRESGYDRVAYGALASLCVGALLVPAAMTTFGLGIRDGGPLGIRPVADGYSLKTAYGGEIAAVDHLCAGIPRGSAVVIISHQLSRRITQIVRGTCGDPAAVLPYPRASRVGRVVRGIEQAGRRPVLLAASRSELTSYGGAVKEILALRTSQNGTTYTSPPKRTRPLTINVWMVEPTS